MQDPISDMLTIIRNGQKAGLKQVKMPGYKLKAAILKVLLEEGYIQSYEITEGKKPELMITLKYFDHKPVISVIKRISKPSLRIYESCKTLPKVMGGLGVAIVSTPRGVMTDHAARKLNVGGEVLCYVE